MGNLETPGEDARKLDWRKLAFVALAALCALPFVGTGMALAAGIIFSFTAGNPWPKKTAKFSKYLLQVSVVGLGFGIPVMEVWRVGRSSLWFTALGILFTLAVGMLLGRMAGTGRRTSALISAGTAICGGSAIAALAPAIDAEPDESAVALATIFTLNAVALFAFPVAGHWLDLTQAQFGTWAGMAIHDTSSVVGAAAAYGHEALDIGTTVKLSRAVWIAPVVMCVAFAMGRRGRPQLPLFIVGFIAAACLAAVLPQLGGLWKALSLVARQSLVVTLFLIGAGLGPEVLRRVGVRPLVQGVVLWVIVSLATLEAVMRGWVA